jgi:hypothetical protein
LDSGLTAIASGDVRTDRHERDGAGVKALLTTLAGHHIDT